MLRWIVIVLLVLVPFAAQAATLTVRVENIDAKGGILRLSLYDEAAWTKERASPVASADVPAVAPETVVTLTDIKPGVYGVKTYQDANSNGRFDRNFLGLPLERYGFSRDAKPFLSAPGFDQTKFTVTDGENEIIIHLQ
jgi:uncharacterized protein (DUF2141 family)